MTRNGGLGLVLLSMCLALPPLGAQTEDQGVIELKPTTEELARFTAADGTWLVAGRYGGEQDECALAGRAFLKRLAADGSELWHRYHQALDSPPCNDREGQLLLEPFTSLDPTYVVGSSLHDVVVDPTTDEIYATGQVQLAWQGPSGPLAARGAIVGHWDAAGNLIRDAYLGPVPGNLPSSPGGCLMLCSLPLDDPNVDLPEEYMGRGLALHGKDVVVTGSHRQWIGKDRDIFVARWTGYPWVLDWVLADGTAGEDEGRALAVDPSGDIYMTGFAGEERDVILARVRSIGELSAVALFGGPLDDEGRALEIDRGEVVASGVFSGELTFGDQTLFAQPDKTLDWEARFDKLLNPTAATAVETVEAPENWQSPAPIGGDKARQIGAPSSVMESHTILPMAYDVMKGTKGRGGLTEIAASDDRYLRIVADSEQQIELKVWLDPNAESHDMPLFLNEIRAEVRSQSCYTATVWVNGVSGPEFVVAGQRQLCPSDEPILTVPITREFSAELGFDGQLPLLPEQRLTIVLSIQFHYTPPVLPGGIFPQTAEQDSSVDQISADVEY